MDFTTEDIARMRSEMLTPAPAVEGPVILAKSKGQIVHGDLIEETDDDE